MWTQDGLTINGVASPACFFSRLASFFSFGDIKARFFASRFDRWDFDMLSAPVMVQQRLLRENTWLKPKAVLPWCFNQSGAVVCHGVSLWKGVARMRNACVRSLRP